MILKVPTVYCDNTDRLLQEMGYGSAGTGVFAKSTRCFHDSKSGTFFFLEENGVLWSYYKSESRWSRSLLDFENLPGRTDRPIRGVGSRRAVQRSPREIVFIDGTSSIMAPEKHSIVDFDSGEGKDYWVLSNGIAFERNKSGAFAGKSKLMDETQFSRKMHMDAKDLQDLIGEQVIDGAWVLVLKKKLLVYNQKSRSWTALDCKTANGQIRTANECQVANGRIFVLSEGKILEIKIESQLDSSQSKLFRHQEFPVSSSSPRISSIHKWNGELIGVSTDGKLFAISEDGKRIAEKFEKDLEKHWHEKLEREKRRREQEDIAGSFAQEGSNGNRPIEAHKPAIQRYRIVRFQEETRGTCLLDMEINGFDYSVRYSPYDSPSIEILKEYSFSSRVPDKPDFQIRSRLEPIEYNNGVHFRMKQDRIVSVAVDDEAVYYELAPRDISKSSPETYKWEPSDAIGKRVVEADGITGVIKRKQREELSKEDEEIFNRQRRSAGLTHLFFFRLRSPTFDGTDMFICTKRP